MAFTVAIAQPTGVGSAVGTKGLSGAWLTEPVIITLPADQHAYAVSIVDQSTGVGAILTGGATAAASLAAVGKGSVRLLIRYRATSVSRWETGYRVVRFQRDADGTNLETVAPALLETPAETAEARGYADIMDQVVSRVNDVEARPYAPTPTLTAAAVDPADLDLVTATYSMAVTHASVAGITIPNTGRTVTGVASGDTTTTPVYQLSGALVQATDAGELLTIAESNGVRSAFGAMAAAATAPLVFGMNRAARYVMALHQSNGLAEAHGPQIGHGADRAQHGADILGWNDQTGAWSAVVSGGAYVRANASGAGTGTGPGLGLTYSRFARLLADEIADDVHIIAHGRTGQGYPYHSKTSVTLTYLGEGATQHATLNTYNFVLSLWAAAGVQPDVIFVDWGEAHNGESKASFKPKRAEYIADLHADYPLASIVLCTPVSPPITGALDVTGVREADAELAAELDYVYVFDADDLAASSTAETLSDMRETSQDPTGVHWSQQGFVTKGEWLWEWYQENAQPAHTAMDAPSVGALMHWAEKRSVQAPSDHIIWPEHVSNVKSLTPLGGDADTPQHVPYLAALNNRSATLFSSTTKAMGVGSITITDNDLLTFIVVCYPSDVATANQFVMSAYNSTVTGARLGLQLVNPSGGMMSIHGVGGTDYSFGAGAAPLAVPQVLALQYGADVRLFRAGNGAIGQVGNTLTLAGTGGAQNFGVAIDLAIGATAVDFASGNFRGHVAEAMLFNSEPGTVALTAKMASLARKYGISIA